MSAFSVTVTRIAAIHPHANADKLELAQVGDYRCCVLKDRYKAGDLVAYIPEAALLPDPVLETLNLKGSTMLAGKARNRVKAIRLRGELSQGICYPPEPGWVEGQDVAEMLGIVKFVPPIPASLNGELWNAGAARCFSYDIENVKRFPDILVEGEPVVFTEKIHGTWTGLALLPEAMTDPDEGDFLIGSKGLFGSGLCFKVNEKNQQNLYVRLARYFDVRERIRRVFSSDLDAGKPVYVLGEAFGIQDLKYGAATEHDEHLGFRIFDVRVGRHGPFRNDADLDRDCASLGLPRVPVLYRGPFSKAVMLEYTEGPEAVSGKALHLREGIVVTPAVEREAMPIGRVKLKSVSPSYLLRHGKNGEEPTEFE
jgi:RNA ligase (TIGR02306 family)